MHPGLYTLAYEGLQEKLLDKIQVSIGICLITCVEVWQGVAGSVGDQEKRYGARLRNQPYRAESVRACSATSCPNEFQWLSVGNFIGCWY